ncbi:tRNA (adenine-N(1)-)-methyltransferase catalytic subunit trm61 [Bachmanniomyces sp. S44760]|nr:tRNA (adenine-N(1)-)-methyltransferase catalytic subunit trm61 [Bachmanniomyces sp. S44760]
MEDSSTKCASPFLDPGVYARQDALAVLHLSRDLQIPTVLRVSDELNEGYDEGKVTNTRFGSFPHSTLIDVPWGTQIRASAVDTGSRGRKGPNGKPAKNQKRKRDDEGIEKSVVTPNLKKGISDGSRAPKTAVTASTGFIHLLPPTPESWTTSLPHRTQVVYTPDYSYILQRLRVRPGSVVIEAGAGSGSFTHAAARAIFNGYPERKAGGEISGGIVGCIDKGKVWSYEFHEQRVEKLKKEIGDHGLEGLVEITHRDVCQDGFMPGNVTGTCSEQETRQINANAVFLDLPAPWLALRHLTRTPMQRGFPSAPDNAKESNESAQEIAGAPDLDSPALTSDVQRDSPLDPKATTRLCTFSPCIEQVQRTVTTLKQSGWVDIEMVELAAKRIEVRRERVGLQEEGLRGVNASPASVEEALERLREVEGRSKVFHEETSTANNPTTKAKQEGTESAESVPPVTDTSTKSSKTARLSSIQNALQTRKLYKEGRLVHRAEPELKTHTSYLVFAILPRQWSAEDEQAAQKHWSSTHASATDKPNNTKKSNRKMKREAAKDDETVQAQDG